MYKDNLDFMLKSSDFPRAFMLYGDEDYQLEFYASTILSRYEGEVLKLSFDEYNFNQARTHLDQDSLFGDLNILHIKTDKKIPLKDLKSLVMLANSSSGAVFLYELHDGDQRSIADHAKVFGESFARFFAPKSITEAIALLSSHAKKIKLNIAPELLEKIFRIQNENIYLSAAELNKLAMMDENIDGAKIENIISSLSGVSFDTFFDDILRRKNIKNDLTSFFESNVIEEIGFINMLYKQFFRLFVVFSTLRYKPGAKISEILGYNAPSNVQNTLKSQASLFNMSMFLDIFSYLNTCDYELKRQNNKMDKELFLFHALLELQNIIAKHSKN